MRRRSKVKGGAQHYAAGVATFTLAPFLGPFALFLYPLFLGLAKKGIAEEMDKIDLDGDIEIGKTWEESRPWERFCKVSTTRFTGGLLPLSLTREHTFTRDKIEQQRIQSIVESSRARPAFIDRDEDEVDFSSLSSENRRLIEKVNRTIRESDEILKRFGIDSSDD